MSSVGPPSQGCSEKILRVFQKIPDLFSGRQERYRGFFRLLDSTLESSHGTNF
jgi:hypothetical protein